MSLVKPMMQLGFGSLLLFAYDITMLNFLIDNYFEPLNLQPYTVVIILCFILLEFSTIALIAVECSMCGCTCCYCCPCCIINSRLNHFEKAEMYRKLNRIMVFGKAYCAFFIVFAVIGEISSLMNANNSLITVNLVLLNCAVISYMTITTKLNLRVWYELSELEAEVRAAEAVSCEKSTNNEEEIFLNSNK